MLTDEFAPTAYEELCHRANALPPSRKIHLLLDGAFTPRLHRKLSSERKAILFASLPGCTAETEDASPFLTPFDPADKALKALLRRCSGWPMVAAIDTSESLEQLAARLAVWCVVEADGQRFNLRFPDTRRLPAMLEGFSPAQRAQISGPARCWSYIARDGRWRDVELEGIGESPAAEPRLDQRQFAFLVSDSRADELLAQLNDRGFEVFHHPSGSHALVTVALRAAHVAQLADDDLLDWCAWFWSQGRMDDDSDAVSMLQVWRNDLLVKD